MFAIFYNAYKLLIWVVLTLLLASGVVSKMIKGSLYEVIIDGVLMLLSLLMAMRAWKQQRQERDTK